MADKQVFPELNGFIPNEDWRDDFDDMWALAEDRIDGMPKWELLDVCRDLERFFATYPDRETRRGAYYLRGAFSSDGDDFDIWLGDIRRRIEQALAGGHLEPLTQPDPYPYP